MTIYFNPEDNGFYSDEDCGKRQIEVDVLNDDGEVIGKELQPNPVCLLPADAVEITDDLHSELIADQEAGKLIGFDEATQLPVSIDPPPPTDEELANIVKRAGEVYMDTGVTVPFTERDQSGIVAVKAFFDGLQEAVSLGLITQSEADAETTTMKFSNGEKLLLTRATFLPFALWFGRKRNAFFAS